MFRVYRWYWFIWGSIHCLYPADVRLPLTVYYHILRRPTLSSSPGGGVHCGQQIILPSFFMAVVPHWEITCQRNCRVKLLVYVHIQWVIYYDKYIYINFQEKHNLSLVISHSGITEKYWMTVVHKVSFSILRTFRGGEIHPP